MADFYPVQANDFSLAGSGVSSSDTTIVLNSFSTPDGDDLVMADFGTKGFIVIDAGSEFEETVIFTGISTNSDGTVNLTGCTRGVDFKHTAGAFLNSSSRAHSHSGGSRVVLSDPAVFFYEIFKAIDDGLNAGAANANNTTKGLTEVATLAEIDADTATGGTGATLSIDPATLATSKYGTRLPTADEKTMLTGLVAGTLKSVIRYYTSNATWTKPAGLSHIDVELVGGGGGGGGVTAAEGRVGGGGGAGAYSRARFLASALSATESVSIGAAGTGGANGANGTGGGTTTFKSCNGAGGSGGVGSTTGDGSSAGGAGGAGGASGSGDITFLGQDGGGGMGDSDTTVDIAIGGYGGSSYFGGGGRQVTTGNLQIAGVNAKSYGSGGSGAATKTTSQAAGGNGAAGVVIITEYFI